MSALTRHPGSARSKSSIGSAALRAAIVAELPRLGARALRLTKRPSDADDLVNDTIERALCFESTFELGTNLRAWLLQIMHSVFVTRYRKQRRERAALTLVAHDDCIALRPEPLFFPLPLSRATRGALEALPAAFRDVVCLVDLGEHSYKEAAAELGVPVGTIMSRLFRARRMLAAELADAPASRAA